MDAQSLDRAKFLLLAGQMMKVEAFNPSGTVSLGTGVTIGPGLVVTNCHVTRNANRIRLTKGGLNYPVESQHADLEHDICFLRAASWDSKPFAVRSADRPRIGQRVAALGYTGGTGISMREGHVSALYAHDASHIIQSSTAFTSGASGGALLDERGNLLGLLTFRLRGNSRDYYSIPVDWIAQRLPAADQFAEIQPLSGAMAFWQGEAQTLPMFMRVLPLESQGDWIAVVRLAEQWSENEAGNPEPWFVRGRAYANLDRMDAAIKSYNQAVMLAPAHSRAWFGLGQAYLAKGQTDNARRARLALSELDSDLADELEAAVKNKAKQ